MNLNLDDWIVGFVCLFIGLVVALLALSLLAEMLTPLWRKVIEGQWYNSMTVSPSIETVSRSDTAKLYQAMRSVKAKMIREGRHILSVKQGKKS